MSYHFQLSMSAYSQEGRAASRHHKSATHEIPYTNHLYIKQKIITTYSWRRQRTSGQEGMVAEVRGGLLLHICFQESESRLGVEFDCQRSWPSLGTHIFWQGSTSLGIHHLSRQYHQLGFKVPDALASGSCFTNYKICKSHFLPLLRHHPELNSLYYSNFLVSSFDRQLYSHVQHSEP